MPCFAVVVVVVVVVVFFLFCLVLVSWSLFFFSVFVLFDRVVTTVVRVVFCVILNFALLRQVQVADVAWLGPPSSPRTETCETYRTTLGLCVADLSNKAMLASKGRRPAHFE